MRSGARTIVTVIVSALAAAVAVPGAVAEEHMPGVTARTVTIGGTFSLSGPASGYAPIPGAMQAYFSYVNATRGPDGKRGVGGRQIVFKYYDDAVNPAQTVQLTRRLVEQDHVFALVGSLATSTQEAVRDYCNQGKVPQIYVSTGATEFGAQHSKYPWTIGWQPDYQAEAATYGRYIVTNIPNAKIGVLYQNDNFGKDYIAGLEAGLGKQHENQIVATRAHEATDTSVTGQLLDLRAAGVDTLLIVAVPGVNILAYQAMAGMGWKPANIFGTNTSTTSAFLPIAAAKAGESAVNGVISSVWIKDAANPFWANDRGMKLYLSIMAKYAPNADPKNVNAIYGVAKAYTFVQALRAAGPNPTRQSLMAAVTSMNDDTNPFLLPGTVTKTGPNDAFPLSQLQLQRWNNGSFTRFGPLFDLRPKGL